MAERELIILRGAEADLLEIYSRYLNRDENAANRFYNFVDSRLELLRGSPELGPPFTAAIRRLVLVEYPYGIFYSLAGTRLLVLAILDLRQNPARIRERLGLEC